jgi:hypothetical protein
MYKLTLFIALVLVLALVSPRVQPRLPQGLTNLFSNLLFRSLVVFFIIHLAEENLMLSVGVAVVYLAIATGLRLSVLENYENQQQNNGPSVANCGGYDASQAQRVGTIFYPLNDNSRLEKMRNTGLEGTLNQGYPTGTYNF